MFFTWKEKLLLTVGILAFTASTVIGTLTPDGVWYEKTIIEAQKNMSTVSNTTVYVVDAEIPETYAGLNVQNSIDFTGEGMLGEECENSHGVAVANIIGHETIGVNPYVNIVGLKVFPCDMDNRSKTLRPLWDALNHVLVNGKPGDIVNLSLSPVKQKTEHTENILNKIADKGIIIVASAGNNSENDSCEHAYGTTIEEAHVIGGVEPAGFLNLKTQPVEHFTNGECITEYLPGVKILTLNMVGEEIETAGTSFSAALKSGILSIQQ